MIREHGHFSVAFVDEKKGRCCEHCIAKKRVVCMFHTEKREMANVADDESFRAGCSHL